MNSLQSKLLMVAGALCLLMILFPPVERQHRSPELSDGKKLFVLVHSNFEGWAFVTREDLNWLPKRPKAPKNPARPTLLERLERIQANDPETYRLGQLVVSGPVLAGEFGVLLVLLLIGLKWAAGRTESQVYTEP